MTGLKEMAALHCARNAIAVVVSIEFVAMLIAPPHIVWTRS